MGLKAKKPHVSERPGRVTTLLVGDPVRPLARFRSWRIRHQLRALRRLTHFLAPGLLPLLLACGGEGRAAFAHCSVKAAISLVGMASVLGSEAPDSTPVEDEFPNQQI